MPIVEVVAAGIPAGPFYQALLYAMRKKGLRLFTVEQEEMTYVEGEYCLAGRPVHIELIKGEIYRYYAAAPELAEMDWDYVRQLLYTKEEVSA